AASKASISNDDSSGGVIPAHSWRAASATILPVNGPVPVVGLISIFAIIPCSRQRSATCESNGSGSPLNILLYQLPAPTRSKSCQFSSPATPQPLPVRSRLSSWSSEISPSFDNFASNSRSQEHTPELQSRLDL